MNKSILFVLYIWKYTYVWILKKKVYMLSNLWQNILCKAQYLKLQYFWGKRKHIRRTSKCWPCMVLRASPSSGAAAQQTCVSRETNTHTHSHGACSPHHTRALRIVWVRRPEAEQRRRSYTFLRPRLFCHPNFVQDRKLFSTIGFPMCSFLYRFFFFP